MTDSQTTLLSRSLLFPRVLIYIQEGAAWFIPPIKGQCKDVLYWCGALFEKVIIISSVFCHINSVKETGFEMAAKIVGNISI